MPSSSIEPGSIADFLFSWPDWIWHCCFHEFRGSPPLRGTEEEDFVGLAVFFCPTPHAVARNRTEQRRRPRSSFFPFLSSKLCHLLHFLHRLRGQPASEPFLSSKKDLVIMSRGSRGLLFSPYLHFPRENAGGRKRRSPSQKLPSSILRAASKRRNCRRQD